MEIKAIHRYMLKIKRKNGNNFRYSFRKSISYGGLFQGNYYGCYFSFWATDIKDIIDIEKEIYGGTVTLK